MRHPLTSLLSLLMHAIFAKWLADTGALLRSLKNNNRKETPR
jgi:hypothetical protein